MLYLIHCVKLEGVVGGERGRRNFALKPSLYELIMHTCSCKCSMYFPKADLFNHKKIFLSLLCHIPVQQRRYGCHRYNINPVYVYFLYRVYVICDSHIYFLKTTLKKLIYQYFTYLSWNKWIIDILNEFLEETVTIACEMFAEQFNPNGNWQLHSRNIAGRYLARCPGQVFPTLMWLINIWSICAIWQ